MIFAAAPVRLAPNGGSLCVSEAGTRPVLRIMTLFAQYLIRFSPECQEENRGCPPPFSLFPGKTRPAADGSVCRRAGMSSSGLLEMLLDLSHLLGDVQNVVANAFKIGE